MFSHLQLRRKGILVSTLSSLHIWWKGFPEPSTSSCPFWKVAWGIFYFVIYDLIRYGARTKSLPSAKSAALGEKLFLCSGEVTPVFFFCCRGELGVSSWSADRHPWWCIDLGFISCNLDSWEDSLASCLCTFVEFALNFEIDSTWSAVSLLLHAGWSKSLPSPSWESGVPKGTSWSLSFPACYLETSVIWLIVGKKPALFW